jgi:hypothetical protein
MSLVRLGAVLILSACSSASGPVWSPSLTTDAARYAPGAAITTTIVNRSSREIGFGDCPFGFERRVGGAWTTVPQPDRDCDASLHLLPSGRETTLQVDLATPVEPGTYRLVMRIYPVIGEAAKLVRSPSFVIGSGT